MNVFLDVVKQIAFFRFAQLRVPKWDVFYILRCSECARPGALKIFEVEFVTKHKNPKEWRVRKERAPTRYSNSRCVVEGALKVCDVWTSHVR